VSTDASTDRPHTLAHRVQYVALRVVIALLSVVPWRVASSIGGFVGKLGYWPLRIRRRVAEKQIADSFPALDAPARRAIAIGSYENLGRVGIETAIASRLEAGTALDLFHPPTGWEHVEGPAAKGQGVILVSGHLGNWELGAAYVVARGLKLSAVVRRMSNRIFDGYLNRSRQRLGWRIIYDHDATRGIPRAIRDGYVVPLLADQGVQGLSSIFVPFFGRLARTPQGPALFALRLGAPLVLALATREPDGKYRLHFEPVPVTDTGDREADVATIVAAYTLQLENWVRKYPGQYLWQHRRWRRRPDGSMDD
jgi:KDO2-lipid IV(A) lauroyltransferase